MLDERDLQTIGQMIRSEIEQLRQEMATKEELQKLRQEMATKEDLQQVKRESIALQEAYFEPKFRLLGEGIAAIQEKLASLGAAEELEERVDVLETVVKVHSREIEKLKKAQ